MHAVDTNVLVRLIVRDDTKQVERAETFVAGGAWISHLVLAETCWLLDSVYERSAGEIAAAIEMLLNHRQFAIQDSDTVSAALERFRLVRAAGFSDCLIIEIARRNGHLPMGTFDRTFARLDGVQRI